MTVSSVVSVDDSGAVQLASGLGTIRLLNEAGGNVVYLGGSGVSVANGYPLNPSLSMDAPVDLIVSEKIYGICDTGGSATIRVLKSGA